MFSRLVDALREAFIAEDDAFTSLFALDDASVTGTAEMLAARVLKGVNPHDAKDRANFNAALAASRPRSTVDDEGVKSQTIKALDIDYYLHVTSRLLLHDQRAAVDLYLTIQQRVRECHVAHVQQAAAVLPTSFASGSVERRFGDPPPVEPRTATEDLVEIVLDLKRQVKALADTVGKRGFDSVGRQVGPGTHSFEIDLFFC
ncbi:hypothetical protein CYMTET_28129 [Cymbomonas tetramitiformis]|uniref:Uncharacterized protein n=1 Tax=Cymbomonas tetramitiformis TaxID=36881 RepID=A0AAE0KWG6_9CHLO|nr:hypothetical protein CYMTET_28129 [Cymbomonas tetramitiformis]